MLIRKFSPRRQLRQQRQSTGIANFGETSITLVDYGGATSIIRAFAGVPLRNCLKIIEGRALGKMRQQRRLLFTPIPSAGSGQALTFPRQGERILRYSLKGAVVTTYPAGWGWLEIPCLSSGCRFMAPPTSFPHRRPGISLQMSRPDSRPCGAAFLPKCYNPMLYAPCWAFKMSVNRNQINEICWQQRQHQGTDQEEK